MPLICISRTHPPLPPFLTRRPPHPPSVHEVRAGPCGRTLRTGEPLRTYVTLAQLAQLAQRASLRTYARTHARTHERTYVQATRGLRVSRVTERAPALRRSSSSLHLTPTSPHAIVAIPWLDLRPRPPPSRSPLRNTLAVYRPHYVRTYVV